MARNLLLILCVMFVGLRTTLAATEFNDMATCQSCVGNGQVTCRTNYFDRNAYCCDPTEVGSRSCGGSDVFCNTMAKNSLMNAFACPYQRTYCYASSSVI